MRPLIETTEQTIFKLIKELTFILKGFQNDTIICENITFRQFTILECISSYKKLKMTDLNGLLNVEKSTTTRLLEPLVRQGLIEKQKSLSDQRVFELLLTDDGKKTHKAALASIYKHIKLISQLIPAEKKESVREALNIFIDASRRCCGN